MKLRETKLGDVVTLQRGHDLPEGSRKEGPVPVVSSSGITGYHNIAKAQPPGVVTGRYGTLGEVFYIEEPYWPLNTALYAIDFHGNNPRFIAYFLKQVLRSTRSDKAAVPGVNRNDLHEIQVRIPDTDIQGRIANIAAAYDDLIENSLRRIKLLEECARLLFREWFVHFQFPGHEHVRITDGVPQGWSRPSLGDYAPLSYGKALREDRRLPGKVPVYGSSGLVGTHSNSLIRGPGIIVGRKGNVGAVHFAEDDFWPIDTTYFIAGPKVSRYLYFTLSAMNFISTDVAVPGLNRDFAHSRRLLVPLSSLLDPFEEEVRVIYRLIRTLRRQVDALGRARDLLLPRLMSGEVEA